MNTLGGRGLVSTFHKASRPPALSPSCRPRCASPRGTGRPASRARRELLDGNRALCQLEGGTPWGSVLLGLGIPLPPPNSFPHRPRRRLRGVAAGSSTNNRNDGGELRSFLERMTVRPSKGTSEIHLSGRRAASISRRAQAAAGRWGQRDPGRTHTGARLWARTPGAGVPRTLLMVRKKPRTQPRKNGPLGWGWAKGRTKGSIWLFSSNYTEMAHCYRRTTKHASEDGSWATGQGEEAGWVASKTSGFPQELHGGPRSLSWGPDTTILAGGLQGQLWNLSLRRCSSRPSPQPPPASPRPPPSLQ